MKSLDRLMIQNLFTERFIKEKRKIFFESLSIFISSFFKVDFFAAYYLPENSKSICLLYKSGDSDDEKKDKKKQEKKNKKKEKEREEEKEEEKRKKQLRQILASRGKRTKKEERNFHGTYEDLDKIWYYFSFSFFKEEKILLLFSLQEKGKRNLRAKKREKENRPPLFFDDLATHLKKQVEFFKEYNDLTSLSSLVYIDDVTGLYNQRKLYIDLDFLLKKAKKEKTSFACFFIDLDHFKDVNDGYGHFIGTKLLANLAEALKKETVKSQYFYRYGGDEFIILLERTNVFQAKSFAQKLLRTIEELSFTFEPCICLHIQASIGIALCPEHASCPQEIIELSDKMMYEAKRQGRGRAHFIGDKLRKTF